MDIFELVSPSTGLELEPEDRLVALLSDLFSNQPGSGALKGWMLGRNTGVRKASHRQAGIPDRRKTSLDPERLSVVNANIFLSVFANKELPHL